MPPETLDDVLHRIKSEEIRIIPRGCNIRTRYRLGIDIETQINIVRSLKREDFISGPEADDNGTRGSIWKFKKRAFGEILYIKIKYVSPIKVLSCHIDWM